MTPVRPFALPAQSKNRYLEEMLELQRKKAVEKKESDKIMGQ